MTRHKMKIRPSHSWNVSTKRARQIQERLRRRASLTYRPEPIVHVAGVDISVKDGVARAAVVVLRFTDLEVVDIARAERPAEFPYVPGLLTFREAPSILEACELLKVEPELFLFDGQGYAHPRRFGLATHMGVLLDRPSIGCAKTRYIGTYDEPHEQAGYYTPLWDGNEQIGAVLRTRSNVKPLFISPGHKMDTPAALDLVLACSAGFRLPEPTRLAHQAAGGRELAIIE